MSDDCPICGRVLGEINVDQHHLVPKTFKGKTTIRVHKICHRKIHATFTERELLKYYNTVEHLKEHEDIQNFIKWVSKKHPEYYDGTKESSRRKRR